MTALTIHRTTTDTHLDAILGPASADGHEFTAPAGAVILVAANWLRSRGRVIAFRVERDGGTDEMRYTVKPGQTCLFGPFGARYGPDGFEPSVEPVTVKITYPKLRGLRVCAVETPGAQP